MFEQNLTKQEQTELLGKEPTEPLYYMFGEYQYNTNSKERVLSGIRELDYLINGFELGCITIWTGGTNARKDYSNDNDYEANNSTGRKSFLF